MDKWCWGRLSELWLGWFRLYQILPSWMISADIEKGWVFFVRFSMPVEDWERLSVGKDKIQVLALDMGKLSLEKVWLFWVGLNEFECRPAKNGQCSSDYNFPTQIFVSPSVKPVRADSKCLHGPYFHASVFGQQMLNFRKPNSENVA